MSNKKSIAEEKLVELAKAILNSGTSEEESLGHAKRASTAMQLVLVGLTYAMVERIQEILEASDKVLERITDEQVLGRMSPRSLVETYKALNDILNKYSGFASTLHKSIDIEQLESNVLELIAKAREGGQELQPISKEELASEILSLVGKGVN